MRSTKIYDYAISQPNVFVTNRTAWTHIEIGPANKNAIKPHIPYYACTPQFLRGIFTQSDNQLNCIHFFFLEPWNRTHIFYNKWLNYVKKDTDRLKTTKQKVAS